MLALFSWTENLAHSFLDLYKIGYYSKIPSSESPQVWFPESTSPAVTFATWMTSVWVHVDAVHGGNYSWWAGLKWVTSESLCRKLLQQAVMFFQQPLVGHNMFMDLCHLHDKFYKPLPGNAVCICCPCLCPRCLLPLQQGWEAGHSAPQQVALQCLVLVTSSALCWSRASFLGWNAVGFSSVSWRFYPCVLLSESYEEFKRNIHNLFPVLIDTKTVTKSIWRVRCDGASVWR